MTQTAPKTERGRFAPSPSGRMHLGNALSALICWLDIRKLKGEMVFRLEDLDPQRSKKQFSQWIIEDIKWLGLDWDEGPDIGGDKGPYNQSERRNLYEEHLSILQHRGLVYPCFCTRSELHDASAPHASDGEPIYSGICRTTHRPSPQDQLGLHQPNQRLPNLRLPALRLQVHDTPFQFDDLHYGPQTQLLTELSGDFILKRSDGIHAYQLAVTVDDALMGITRVVRGDDLLTSVSRQMYLHQLLGYTPPLYGHVPLMVGPDGKRLSKRHFSTDLGYWQQSGVSPEHIVGYLASSAGLIDRFEPVKATELIQHFEWCKVKHEPIVVSENSLTSVIYK